VWLEQEDTSQQGKEQPGLDTSEHCRVSQQWMQRISFRNPARTTSKGSLAWALSLFEAKLDGYGVPDGETVMVHSQYGK
jgi:hypothetical protein